MLHLQLIHQGLKLIHIHSKFETPKWIKIETLVNIYINPKLIQIGQNMIHTQK